LIRWIEPDETPKETNMDYKRIFVNLTHGAIGDTVYTYPLLKALRSACPEAEIHVATWFYIQGMLDLAPEVSIIPMIAKDLRTEIVYRISKLPDFDLAINLNYDRLSMIETIATGAPVRVGSEQTECPDWWLTHRVPVSNDRHKLDEVLDMGEAAGIPRPEGPHRIDIPAGSVWSEKLGEHTGRLKERGLTLVGIHPGAKFDFRVWSVERFSEFCKRLIVERKAVIFLFGAGYSQAPGNVVIPDRERIIAIKGSLGELESLAVDTRTVIPVGDFSALAALMSKLDLYIGHDTGPTHLAAMVGCPVIDLMGVGHPGRWKPLGDKVILIDRPPADEKSPEEEKGETENRRLETVSVDEVLEAATKLLNR
jgi:ADP-heptose:LPS heptosyltransferase